MKTALWASKNPIETLAGQYYDAETGLHYNYHRYYDPATGRYLTPDPIGLAGGIILFAYGNNNPVNFVDPEGLVWFRPDGAPYYVGRKGTPIEPGIGTGADLENYVPGMHDMGFLHDDIVTNLRANGLPDWLVNIPTIPIAYTASVLGNLFGHSYTTYPDDPCE